MQELLEGEELYDRLVANSSFTEEKARGYFLQVMQSIGYLHEHKIAHRDIKPENFVFESKNGDCLKLIDFGLSSHFMETN